MECQSLSPSPSSTPRVEWIDNFTMEKLCRIDSTLNDASSNLMGVFLLFGSWNHPTLLNQGETLLRNWRPTTAFSDNNETISNVLFVTGTIQVDESEESLSICVGDDESLLDMQGCYPSDLPALVAVSCCQDAVHKKPLFEIVPITPNQIMQHEEHVNALNSIQTSLSNLLSRSRGNNNNNDMMGSSRKRPRPKTKSMEYIQNVSHDLNQINHQNIQERQQQQLRLFVAGDRSQVGKSTVCMGLLGALLRSFAPSQLAYIKPATQCEATQLVETFCQQYGIQCRPVGPVVYYKGFTRAFLKGETPSSEHLLRQASQAVNEIARDKKVVLIDGVGYPAVGSICGTDNATVARACGADGVLIVGPGGVGHSVDSFNLNATYFVSQNVTVIGAIFNKNENNGGFYSLEHCREQVTRYFELYQPLRKAFGFLPKVESLTTLEEANDFVELFCQHVNVDEILARLWQEKASPTTTTTLPKENKHYKMAEPTTTTASMIKSRDEIEMQAESLGASGG